MVSVHTGSVNLRWKEPSRCATGQTRGQINMHLFQSRTSHTRTHAHTHMHRRTHMRTDMHNTHTQTHTHTRTHAHTHTRTHAHTHTRTRTHTHTHVHTHAHTHTDTHTHLLTRARGRFWPSDSNPKSAPAPPLVRNVRFGTRGGVRQQVQYWGTPHCMLTRPVGSDCSPLCVVYSHVSSTALRHIFSALKQARLAALEN